MSRTSYPSIFVSYASPDRNRVIPIANFMRDSGYEVWMDVDDLLGGQSWDQEIRRALDAAQIIVMFISNNSTVRRGYVQREIRLALSKLETTLHDDIYIIPVLLDTDAPRPEQLSGIQFIDANSAQFRLELIKSIKHELDVSTVPKEKDSRKDILIWNKNTISEEWSGLPGYKFLAEIIDLQSPLFPRVSECSKVISGYIHRELMHQRLLVMMQSPELFNFGMAVHQ